MANHKQSAMPDGRKQQPGFTLAPFAGPNNGGPEFLHLRVVGTLVGDASLTSLLKTRPLCFQQSLHVIITFRRAEIFAVFLNNS